MPKFIFAYHLPRGYVPGSTPEATAAWGSFFEGMADSKKVKELIHNPTLRFLYGPGMQYMETLQEMQTQLRSADVQALPDKAMFVGLKTGGQLASPEHAAARVLTYLDRADFGSNPLGDVRDA